MKRLSNLMLCATIACCAGAAQAGTSLKTSDVPMITNGGTGFIGVTQSAGMPSQPFNTRWAASVAITPIPLRAGEASTFVNGRPNEDPNAPGLNAMAVTGDHTTSNLRTMGGSMADFPAGAHPQWGTPD